MKNYKENQKSSYKPSIGVNKIAELQRANPDMMYYGVRVDDMYDPDGLELEKFLDKGWEYAVTDQKVEDDRDSTKSKESMLEKYKPSTITRNGKGGAIFVYLCKPKDQWLADQKKDAKQEEERFKLSSPGRKIERKGNNVRITDAEANENNLN